GGRECSRHVRRDPSHQWDHGDSASPRRPYCGHDYRSSWAARRWRQAPPSSATSTSKAATRDAPTPLPTAAARAITLPAKSGGDLCPDLVLKIGAYVACQSRPFVFVRI